MHLASKELLQKCFRGATQNANELYKGLVWSFCQTREEFCGAGTAQIVANPAVLQFNNRTKAVAKVMEDMVFSTSLLWLKRENPWDFLFKIATEKGKGQTQI